MNSKLLNKYFILKLNIPTYLKYYLGKKFSRQYIQITPKGNTTQTQLTGKNLCDISLLPITQYGITISKNSNGNIIINGTPDYSDGYKSFRIGTDRTIPVGQYSVSIDTKINGIGFANGIPYANLSMSDTERVKTVTTSGNSTITPIINIRYDVGTLNNFILNPQVEAGTPTDYEQYCGGVPSPNPDYPQDIKVVKGDNTVTVKQENTTIATKQLNLGNLELCKIGEYQDYIYKSNDNWYKKEFIAKQNLNDLTGWWFGNVTYRIYAEKTEINCIETVLPMSNYLIGCKTSNPIITGGIALQNFSNKVRFNCYITEFDNDINAFKSWLASAKPVCYYVNPNTTDIQITDTTLIEQLEALNRVELPLGDITIITESDNDNADLIVTYKKL